MREPEKTYLTSAAVRARYGVSDMTIWRWLRSTELGFPAPLRINGRRFWKLTQLEAWEASRSAIADEKSTAPVRGRSDSGYEHNRQTRRAA